MPRVRLELTTYLYASAVASAARPAQRLKLADQVGDFGRVEKVCDLSGGRLPWYRLACHSSVHLVWSRPRRLQSRGGSLWDLQV